jgi:hypothetical protein
MNPELMQLQINEIIKRLSVVEARLDTARPGATNTIVLDKELDRVLEKIQTIKATYSGMQNWIAADRVKLLKLVKRKREIMDLLGVKE